MRRVTISVHCGKEFTDQHPHVVVFLISEGLEGALLACRPCSCNRPWYKQKRDRSVLGCLLQALFCCI